MLSCAKREWAITENAFMSFLKLGYNGIKQLKELEIEKLECNNLTYDDYWINLKNNTPGLLTSELGISLLYLFENDILVKDKIKDATEIGQIYYQMDRYAPDNHAIIVETIAEYVEARKYYGKEDIYFWRKMNGSR